MPDNQPLYSDPEEMKLKFDEYFEDCKQTGDIPNIVGMYLYLGFASRQSLTDYEKKGGRFLHVIKQAKSKCYQTKFQKAMKGEINTTVFIFDAVNNHDMFNTRSENKNDNKNEHKGNIDLSVNFVESADD